MAQRGFAILSFDACYILLGPHLQGKTFRRNARETSTHKGLIDEGGAEHLQFKVERLPFSSLCASLPAPLKNNVFLKAYPTRLKMALRLTFFFLRKMQFAGDKYAIRVREQLVLQPVLLLLGNTIMQSASERERFRRELLS